MADVPRTPTNSRRRKRRQEFLVVGGVLVVLAAALAYAARDVLTQRADEAAPAAKPQAETTSAPAQAKVPVDDLVDDDGRTLWVSPTHGRPLDLAFLPPQSEIVLALRPADLSANLEGEKVLAALGPLGRRAIDEVTRTTGLSLSEVKQLIVGWRIERDFGWSYTQIVHVQGEVDRTELRARLAEHLTHSYVDRTFVFADGRVYFDWGRDGTPHLVEGTPEMFVELFPRDPLLPRDVSRLVKHTDLERQVTLIFRPQFLLGDQHDLLSGAYAPVRPVLEEFLGDSAAAVALSLDWGDDFFIELRVVPTLDSSPERMSEELAARVNELPDRVEDYVLSLDVSPYGKRVVARLPEMVRRLAAYTRHGHDQDCAVLRCYLPLTAGHNLLMGAELALAEGEGSDTHVARDGRGPLAEATSPVSLAERLQKTTTLRFGREELEAALDMLAADIGVKIVIRGQDLQLDGITRNQLFGIDMADRTAEEILVEMLRRANPDKTATGPADPRQKLVYILGPESIIITTRARAAERGDPLPTVFQPK